MKMITARLFILLLAMLFLQGCLNKLNVAGYKINYPQANKTYIGTVNQLPPNGSGSFSPLNEEFEITYATPPSGKVDIVLNGHNISQYFTVGPNAAIGNIEKFKQFFRHGKNTLSVSPTSFGPSIIFNLDLEGPQILITRGEVIGGNKIEIEGFLRDFSLFDDRLQLDLVKANGYGSDGRLNRQLASTRIIDVEFDGKFCAVDVGSPNLVNGRCENGASPTGAVVLGTLLTESPLLYSFTAKDQYGFSSFREFAADNDGGKALPLVNAVQVAIGDTFIESMRPVIASAIYTTLSAAPIDARCLANSTPTNYATSGTTCASWNDPKICGVRGVFSGKYLTQAEFDKLDLADSTANPKVKDQKVGGKSITDASFNCAASFYDVRTKKTTTVSDWNTDGGKLPSGLNPVKVTISPLPTMNAYVQRFYMHDGEDISVGGKNLKNKVGTVLLNGLKIKENNILDIDMVINEMVVKLAIPGTTLSIPSLGMYIENIVVDTEARVEKTPGGVVEVELQNSNFQFGGDLLLNDAEACIRIIIQICIPLDGLGNIFIPLLKGVIADLLPGIMNPILAENLQKIVIGGTLTQPENQTSFDAVLNIAQMGTGNLLGLGSAYDLKVSLDSLVDVKKPDPNVNPLLGPVFYDDPIDPSIMYNDLAGSNLTVAINSNLVNQSLAAMHAAGVTFFTMHNDKVYYGAHPQTPAIDPTNNASLTKAVKGDTRIRLWPDMPPAIVFSETIGKAGEGRAAIEFESATLYFDELRSVDGQLKWVSIIELQVNFDLAVGINENDGVFTMAAAGPPVFTINKMINRTNLLVPPSLIQRVLDVAMLFGGDILADRFIILDLGKIASNTINGTVVRFTSNADRWTIPNGSNGCIEVDKQQYPTAPHEGVYKDPETGLPLGTVTNGSDSKYDIICHTIDFAVTTNTAGVTGAKGTNLFFQMAANATDLPPPPAIPRFDLDDDNVVDYRDNCALPVTMLVEAVKVNGGPGAPGNLDAEGNPSVTYSNAVKTAANNLLATQKGYASPTSGDIDWFNTMRIGDLPVASGSTWLRTLFANAKQSNTDGDRIGDLCENDDDRDGIWEDYANNPTKNDNCPEIANSDQTSTITSGVGDACNVKSTFVLIQSLGSRYTNASQPNTPTSTGYKCLTHSAYKVQSATVDGASISSDMRNTGGAGPTVADCNQADANQRWYIQQTNAANNYYSIFADASRSNQNSWQLGAYDNAGNGHLRMIKFNSTSTRVGAASNRHNGPWKFSVDPSVTSSSTLEDQSHPWILQPTSILDIGQKDCLFYNTDGWGPDFNKNECLTSFATGVTQPLLPKFYRWGIFIQGKQLWYGE